MDLAIPLVNQFGKSVWQFDSSIGFDLAIQLGKWIRQIRLANGFGKSI
jgi:hypothetical protein